MNRLFFLCASLMLASTSAAQTYLSEDFNSGSIPPGWTQIQAGPNFSGWVVDAASRRLWHEDFTGTTTDNRMVTPVLDLSTAGAAELRFTGQTNYAQYLANHPNSVGDGVSTVEVTTNGGLTWSIVWTDTAHHSSGIYRPVVDLDAFLESSSVQVAFHFYGTFAQEWWIDDVVVDAGAPGGTLQVTSMATGTPADVLISDAAPGGLVSVAYSLAGTGPSVTPELIWSP